MICPECNSENVKTRQEWEEYFDGEDWEEYSYWFSECLDCGHQFSPDE